MSQAIVDPEQLRRFAQNLNASMRLAEPVDDAARPVEESEPTWRDKEQQKFNEEFEQTMLALSKFIEAADVHVPFLLRKADRAEEYLRQR